MKRIAILVVVLFGCAFSLPTPEDDCNCGNVIHSNFQDKKILKMMHNLKQKLFSLKQKKFEAEKKIPPK